MFRLRFEVLESRENPSGPDLMDPTAPINPGTAPTEPVVTQPPTTPPAPTTPPSNVPPMEPIANPLG